MDLIEIIQKIVQDDIKELKLTDLVCGTVITSAPLSIQIDSMMQPIPEQALILTDNVKAKSYSGKTSDGATFTVIINQALQAGERVILLRCSGGQRFIVLSRA